MYNNFFSIAKTQEIPNEFYQFKIEKFFSNNLKNWSNISSFGPFRYKVIIDSSKISKLSYNSKYSYIIENDNISISMYGRYYFQNNYYGYHYTRAVNNLNHFERFSGLLFE